jgi:16S rRNA (guanine527-N7)-methyltransferase
MTKPLEFQAFLASKGFSTTEVEAALPKLMAYRDKVLEWNNKVNLTAITNPDEFVQKHYVDSLICADAEEVKAAKLVLDVGTGGGFPGIPLAVMFPEKRFVLLDSLQKRLKIVKQIADELGIDNVEVLHGRAEDLARTAAYREKFDLCVSRAVANLSTLSELCLPFVRVGGTFLSYKGPSADDEIKAAEKAIRLLGGKLKRIDNPKSAHFALDHTMIYINKEKKTPAIYPRKAGTPAKEPIK